MYRIRKTSRFKSSYKRLKSDKKFKVKIFEGILENLSLGKKLDEKYKDHQLSGDLSDYRECHITPDILLIYKTKDLNLF